VALSPRGAVVVLDEVSARGAHALSYAAPLGPDLTARAAEGGAVIEGRGGAWRLVTDGGPVRTEDGGYAVALGGRVPRPVLAWTHTGPWPARVVHVRARCRPARVTTSTILGGEVRVTLRSDAGEEVGYLPAGSGREAAHRPRHAVLPAGDRRAAEPHARTAARSSPRHRVTVLTAFPNHPRASCRRAGRPAREHQRHAVEGGAPVRVLRAWLLAAPTRGAFRRTLGHLTAAATTFLRGLAGCGGADAIVATSPPLFTGLAGLALARLHRRPVLLDVRDLWPDAFVDLGLAREGRVVALFRRLERFLYRHADHVVPVTEAFRARIEGHGVPAARLTVVRNGVDLARFPRALDPAAVAAAKRAYGVEGRFTLLYLGAHGVAQGLDRLLPAVLDAGPRTTFLFVGEGAEKAKCVAEAARLRLGDRVRILPGVPRDEVPRVYAAADGLVALRATPLMETFLPSKAFGAFGAGRPVVGGGGRGAGAAHGGPGAVVVPPGTPRPCARRARVGGRRRPWRSSARRPARGPSASSLRRARRDVPPRDRRRDPRCSARGGGPAAPRGTTGATGGSGPTGPDAGRGMGGAGGGPVGGPVGGAP
jgi:glycosyltransferase involved in cell wall biosynthesis